MSIDGSDPSPCDIPWSLEERERWPTEVRRDWETLAAVTAYGAALIAVQATLSTWREMPEKARECVRKLPAAATFAARAVLALTGDSE